MRDRFLGIVFLVSIFAIMSYVIVRPGISHMSRSQTEDVQVFNVLDAYPFQDRTDSETDAQEIDAQEADAQEADAQEADAQEADAQEANVTVANVRSFVSELSEIENKFRNIIAYHVSSDSDTNLVGFRVGKRWADRIMGLDVTASVTSGRVDMNGYNIVISLGNGYLAYALPEMGTAAYEDAFANLGALAESRGKAFALMLAPTQQVDSSVYMHHAQEERNALRMRLSEDGFDTIDVGEAAAAEGFCSEDMFFKTDHHWTLPMWLLAGRLLCEWMNDRINAGIDVSMLDEDRYDVQIVDRGFLGTLGRTATTAYCTKEDFPIVLPAYDTELEVFLSNTCQTTTGSVAETLFNWDNLGMAISHPYAADAYMSYCYGDMAMITIHNRVLSSGPSILVVADSFGDPVCQLLAPVVKDLCIIDARYFNGSIQTLFDAVDPDAVVVIAGGSHSQGGGLINGLRDWRPEA